MPLPGDDLVPSPLVETTHAVTINGVCSQNSLTCGDASVVGQVLIG
jgi:hypothetical protein